MSEDAILVRAIGAQDDDDADLMQLAGGLRAELPELDATPQRQEKLVDAWLARHAPGA